MLRVVGPHSPGDGDRGQCRNAELEAHMDFAAGCRVTNRPWPHLHPWHPPLDPTTEMITQENPVTRFMASRQ